MTLIELAERVEAAEGPNRDLNREIALAVGWVWRQPEGLKFEYWFNPSGAREDPKPFTTSIDAAMTLVPDRCNWLRKDFRTMTVVIASDDLKVWGTHIDGTGATPALALCAAALRAQGIEAGTGETAKAARPRSGESPVPERDAPPPCGKGGIHDSI